MEEPQVWAQAQQNLPLSISFSFCFLVQSKRKAFGLSCCASNENLEFTKESHIISCIMWECPNSQALLMLFFTKSEWSCYGTCPRTQVMSGQPWKWQKLSRNQKSLAPGPGLCIIPGQAWVTLGVICVQGPALLAVNKPGLKEGSSTNFIHSFAECLLCVILCYRPHWCWDLVNKKRSLFTYNILWEETDNQYNAGLGREMEDVGRGVILHSIYYLEC